MTDFETILARLEESPPSVARAHAFGLGSIPDSRDDPAGTSAQADANRTASIAAAYGQLSSETRTRTTNEPTRTASRTAPRAARPPDREALLRELRLAERSIDDLSALRRKLAWLCHPDRNRAAGRQGEHLLAEFNARIDAAIQRIRRSAASPPRSGPRSADPGFRDRRSGADRRA